MNDFDGSHGGTAPYDMFGLNPQLLRSLAIHSPLVKRVFVASATRLGMRN
jgi:hypothetical protein